VPRRTHPDRTGAVSMSILSVPCHIGRLVPLSWSARRDGLTGHVLSITVRLQSQEVNTGRTIVDKQKSWSGPQHRLHVQLARHQQVRRNHSCTCIWIVRPSAEERIVPAYGNTSDRVMSRSPYCDFTEINPVRVLTQCDR
jgi:hypothetical protein